MDALTYALLKNNGGSADVTAAAVASAIGRMNDTQKANSRTALGAAMEPMVVEITESAGAYSASESLADIQAAIAAGREVRSVNEWGAEGLLIGHETSAVELASFDDQNGGRGLALRVYTIEAASVNCQEYLFAKEPVRETKSGPSVSISPQNNHIYTCGEITSLTIATSPAQGAYMIRFSTGAASPNVAVPSGLTLSETTFEANHIYEINVLDGIGFVGGVEVSGS